MSFGGKETIKLVLQTKRNLIAVDYVVDFACYLKTVFKTLVLESRLWSWCYEFWMQFLGESIVKCMLKNFWQNINQILYSPGICI